MLKLNNIRRIVAFLAVAGTILVAATVAVRMQRDKTLQTAVRKLPVQIDVSLQAVHFTETRRGVKQWDLTAERAEYDKSKGRTTLSGVRLVVLNSSAGEIRVSAQRAQYDHASKDVRLTGDVRGESASGLSFATPALHYVAARSTLVSADRVTLKNAGLSLEGVGMELHTKSQKLKLSSVNAEVRPGSVRP